MIRNKKDQTKVKVKSINKNEEIRKENIFKTKIFFKFALFIIIMQAIKTKAFASIETNTGIDTTGLADGMWNLTDVLLVVLISVGLVLILLAIALLIRVKALKQATENIEKFTQIYGMHPNDAMNMHKQGDFNLNNDLNQYNR